MTPPLPLPDNHTDIWLVHLPSITAEGLTECAQLLCDEEREQLDHYRNPKVYREALVSRAAVRACLSQYTERLAPPEWPLERTPHGKPQLAPNAPLPLSFNPSHSGDWLAIVVSLGVDVGIDVQERNPRYTALELGRRYFHPEEAAELEACDEEGRREAFFYLWTLKEAFLKARGTGISTGLDKAWFNLGATPIRAQLSDDLHEDAEQWQFEHYHLGDTYCLSVAQRRSPQVATASRFWQWLPSQPAKKLALSGNHIQT